MQTCRNLLELCQTLIGQRNGDGIHGHLLQGDYHRRWRNANDLLACSPLWKLPPGSQVGSRSPSPLRTERASFPALRSSMINAPRGTRRCSCALWCIVNLAMTVGMAEYQICLSGILAV